jgi:acyl-CoA thioester hydrolase
MTETSFQVETAGRPDPARLHLPVYPVTKTISSRYADLDPNGHLNNVALTAMHEDIRATFNNEIFPQIHNPSAAGVRLLISQNVVHFLAEAHWPATIEAGIGVARIGRTSFVVSSALFVDHRCISLSDTVVVTAQDRPVPLSEATRSALQGLQLRG